MEPKDLEAPAAARAEKLIRLAESAKLFDAAAAARARDRAKECLAKDPHCPVGRILVHSGLVGHAQLEALLALERYRDERNAAKPLVQQAVREGRLDVAAARAALEMQAAEYRRTGTTIPIRDCLLDQTVIAAAEAARLDWSGEEDMSEFQVQPSADELPAIPLPPMLALAHPPIAPAAGQARRRTGSSAERLLARRRAEKRRARIATVVLGTLLGLPLGAYFLSTTASSDAPPSPSSHEESEAATRVTASRLWQDFGQNRLAATERWSDKPVLVSGRIVEIRTDALDRPIIELETGDRADRVRCEMDPAERGAARALSAGRVVLVRGICRAPGSQGRAPRVEGGRFAE